MAQARAEIVSDENEALILVDSDDVAIGTLDKGACHDGNGVLHRAFSLFVFNGQGQVLLQQRAPGKRLWPNYWANSCCSHPRAGEDMTTATARRCEQELGFATRFEFVYKFEYQAHFGELGTEHELCSVFVGRYDGELNVNQTEIQAVQWLAPADLDHALLNEPDKYTPWLKLEWQALRQEHANALPIPG